MFSKQIHEEAQTWEVGVDAEGPGVLDVRSERHAPVGTPTRGRGEQQPRRVGGATSEDELTCNMETRAVEQTDEEKQCSWQLQCEVPCLLCQSLLIKGGPGQGTWVGGHGEGHMGTSSLVRQYHTTKVLALRVQTQ